MSSDTRERITLWPCFHLSSGPREHQEFLPTAPFPSQHHSLAVAGESSAAYRGKKVESNRTRKWVKNTKSGCKDGCACRWRNECAVQPREITSVLKRLSKAAMFALGCFFFSFFFKFCNILQPPLLSHSQPVSYPKACTAPRMTAQRRVQYAQQSQAHKTLGSKWWILLLNHRPRHVSLNRKAVNVQRNWMCNSATIIRQSAHSDL